MLTYSARLPVSGWVRTAGCSADMGWRAASVPSDLIRSSRVRLTSALAEVETPVAPSRKRFMPGERVS